MMIRLPPSVICLAPSDLLDYDDRRQQRELENVKKQFAQFELDAQDGPKFRRSRQSHTSQYDLPIRHLSDQGPLYPTFGGADSSDDQSGLVSRVGSPENISLDAQHPSSPPKDAFHYGGFLESPTGRSSPFSPGDISTPPQTLLPPTNQRYHARTLPRSPLYLSHNASSSPERRPTSSLTPRVASRVANHNTPGLIFSQPARRPNFRHQTNSFSFDSSERASAAYEQDRISSLSTTDTIDTTPRPTHGVRLRDELRGSSLSSSQVSTEVLSQDLEESEGLEESTFVPPETQGAGRTFIFSSPRLPLPAPFSTTSRSVSDAELLPSSPRKYSIGLSERSFANPRASPVRSPSRSPNPSPGLNDYEVVLETSGLLPSPLDNNLVDPPNRRGDFRRTSPVRSSSTSPNHSPGMRDSRRPSPMQVLRSGAARIISYYNPRSPSRSQRVQSLLARYPQTPSRNISVYNDGMPPVTQPQTPAHLPESRHQSRYHPSYTAPVGRARSGLLSVPSRTPDRRGRPPATPSRATRERAASPVGLQTGGFRGLYGGRENGDEEQNWVDGVRFDNAEVSLWGLRDAAADGRTLGDTPEREEWRIGRH